MRSGWPLNPAATRVGPAPRGSVVLRPLLLARSVVVGLLADNVEARVEVDLDHAPVVELHLHAVRGSVIPDLGLDDGATTGVGQSGLGGPLEVRAGQRLVVVPTGGHGD